MTEMKHNEWTIRFAPNEDRRILISHDSRPGRIEIGAQDQLLGHGFYIDVWNQTRQANEASCFASFVELNDIQREIGSEDWDTGLTTMTHLGWEVIFSEDEPNRLYVTHEDHPGSIHIKADDEGFVVDVWPDSHEQVLATCAALYSDLEVKGDEDEG